MNSVSIVLKKGIVPFYSGALQRGCIIDTQVGCSIRKFLNKECRLDDEYIDERIKTFFLNSHPVDNIDKAILRDNASLALSGAMPGLVGAMMRSGTIYSSLRSTITHREDINIRIDKKDGQVKIKLFNVLIRELGSGFFERGLYLGSELFLTFLHEQQPVFWQGCEKVALNNKTISSDKLQKKIIFENINPVFISIKTVL